MKSDQSSKPPLLAFGLCTLLLFVVLAIPFRLSFLPDYTVFSNDGPLGAMVAAQNRLPAIISGMWMDLNWLGNPYPSPGPMPTTALRFVTSPLLCSKILCQFSLFVVGLCAWFCFRQYRFSQITCLLVALAAALNSDFFNTAAWGVCSQPVAFGMNFLALAALADTTSPRRWLRVMLAGFAVGLGVMEAYDIGALFSLFVAAFVIVQSLVGEGAFGKRIVNGVARLAVVGVCAGLIAAAALVALVGTQIKGVAGVGQDAESKAARWDFAVQYSLPKLETLGLVVPGVFGLRHDTPDGGAYWGRGGSDPSWDEYVESGGTRGQPGGAFRAGAGSNYAGVLVVLVAVFALAQTLRQVGGPFSTTERRLVWFWCAVALAGMALMWGRFAPFYQFFYALPYASTIRNPAKFHHILQWALLIVFAYGAEALCRVGFQPPVGAAAPRGKSFWARATDFDRKWIVISVLFVSAFAAGWLMLGAMRGKFEQRLVEYTLLSQGIPLEKAASAPANLMDYAQSTARATAKFSVGQIGRGLLFAIPSAGLVAWILAGGFRGARAKLGGTLLLALLVADLLPFNSAWVEMVNWKQTYETNPTIEFLRQHPHEQRVAIFPLDPNRLPREVAGQAGTLLQLYSLNWKQWLFQYYDIQSLDIVQEPRVPQDKAAYEAVINSFPLRRWELSNTRYLLAPAGLVDVFNQQFDPERKSFRVAHQFNLAAKPGAAGQSGAEITTVPGPGGQLAVLEFTGALPRASLYTNWKISTNEPAKREAWSKAIQQNTNVPLDWRNALAAQSETDLATLQELADKSFDPHQTVLLAEPLGVSPGTNQSAGEVKFVSYAPKHIALKAKAAAPAVLLLNDKYDANWRVTVDGQPAKLLRCNFIARGVFLDKAGEHNVEFHFQPPLAGLYISLAAIAVGLGLLGYVVMAERRQLPAK